jgi:hypothetical protein
MIIHYSNGLIAGITWYPLYKGMSIMLPDTSLTLKGRLIWTTGDEEQMRIFPKVNNQTLPFDLFISYDDDKSVSVLMMLVLIALCGTVYCFTKRCERRPRIPHQRKFI